MEPRSRTRRNLDTCRRGCPLIKLMGYEHREDAVGVWGSKLCQTHTHKHTYTVSLVIHSVDGISGKDRTQS